MEPITRQELFLAAASGENVELPEPITREEMYLKAIVESGGGGGASSLANLKDTSIKSPQNGDILVFDEGKWENSTIEGIDNVGGISFNPMTLDIQHKYINKSSGVLTNDNSSYLAEINVVEGEIYSISGRSQYNTALYAVYDSNNAMIAVMPASDSSSEQRNYVDEVVTIPQGGVLLRACSYQITLIVKKGTQIATALAVSHNDNILWGKKWAVCGDSFTAGDFTGYVDDEGRTGKDSDAYDSVREMWKTYPWWISERNNMDVQLLAMGGNDFTNLQGAVNPFSNPNTAKYNYTQIANDSDYITLQFGLNETSMTTEQIGTKGNSTNDTLWGAYYVVLNSILTANPTAKIGIILSDGWLTNNLDYYNALIDIAKFWGIPYLDLTGNDPKVPMLVNMSDDHALEARRNRIGAMVIDYPSNLHPNVKGHSYRSTIIEDFLRTL